MVFLAGSRLAAETGGIVSGGAATYATRPDVIMATVSARNRKVFMTGLTSHSISNHQMNAPPAGNLHREVHAGLPATRPRRPCVDVTPGLRVLMCVLLWPRR